MKYKVVGWVDSNGNYPENNCSTGACRAVVEEIREHGYLFGGDKHEDYIPILNDGTYCEWSWRGWGGVMAEAHNIEPDNPYRYTFCYMNEFIKNPVYPPRTFEVPSHLIVPRDEIADMYELEVTKEQFDELEKGNVPDEVKRNAAKIKNMDDYDYVVLKEVNGKRQVRALAEYVGTDIVGLSLPSQYNQQDGIEMTVRGKKIKLKMFADRLPFDSKKPLYKCEVEKIESFVCANFLDDDVIKDKIAELLAKNYYPPEGDDSELDPDTVVFDEIHVIANGSHQPIYSVFGSIKYLVGGVAVTFWNNELVGVCEQEDYKHLEYIRYLNGTYY